MDPTSTRQPRSPLSAEPGTLVALARRLLMLTPRLRATWRVEDPAALRDSLAQGLREFARCATQSGVPAEQVMAARYVLCAALDEAAAETPWGGCGRWAQHSLLTLFHDEPWGAEKVFRLMARLAERPRANLELLDLIHAALALGFRGRYRHSEVGEFQLEAVRRRLAAIIRRQRGDDRPTRGRRPGWLGGFAPRMRRLLNLHGPS